MALLLHISDTHFGTEQGPVVAALHALAAEHRPDVLVYSGDLTQRARAWQFAAARRLYDELPAAHKLVLPGNHDIPLFNVVGRLFSPYANYKACFGADLDPVIDAPHFLVIGVNTTRPERHKDGEVSRAQVDRTVALLRGAREGQLRVVVTHQPAEITKTEDVHNRLHGGEAALQAWSAAGADIVLGGHIHLPYVIDLRERATPTPQRTWCVQAGTAVSDRIRQGTCNSVNLVHWSAPADGAGRSCSVERFDYDAASKRFRSVTTTRLDLD